MKKSAFTLAEVLITLGIIGIIAAMTLPVLTAKWQKAAAIAQLKKEYSIMQNAISALLAENEGVKFDSLRFVHQQWDHSDYFDKDLFAEDLSKHLKYIDSGTNPTYSTEVRMCLPEDSEKSYKWLNGSKQTFWSIVSHWWKLSDGSCVAINTRGGWTWDDSSSIVLLYIDINGSEKNPNQFGKDTFVFRISRSGKIVPYELPEPELDCYNKTRRGLDCAAKIMKDGWQIKDDYPW